MSGLLNQNIYCFKICQGTQEKLMNDSLVGQEKQIPWRLLIGRFLGQPYTSDQLQSFQPKRNRSEKRM